MSQPTPAKPAKPALTVSIPETPAFAPDAFAPGKAAAAAGVSTPVQMAIEMDIDSEFPTEPSLWYKKCDWDDPRSPSHTFYTQHTPPRYTTPALPSPTYMPTSLQEHSPAPSAPPALPAPEAQQLDDDMSEQLHRAAVVTAALDREIARLEAQLEGLQK
jgi:hypothetical protein